jgi:hypothetical protein
VKNIPNDRKIYQNLILQDPPKFTQIGLLGSKINHLAALIESCAVWGDKRLYFFAHDGSEIRAALLFLARFAIKKKGRPTGCGQPKPARSAPPSNFDSEAMTKASGNFKNSASLSFPLSLPLSLTLFLSLFLSLSLSSSLSSSLSYSLILSLSL